MPEAEIWLHNDTTKATAPTQSPVLLLLEIGVSLAADLRLVPAGEAAFLSNNFSGFLNDEGDSSYKSLNRNRFLRAAIDAVAADI